MKILNIVLMALVNDNKILLLKRNKKPFIGYWGLPGGKMEFGENIEDSSVREFEEETGIKAKFKELRGIASEILYNKNNKTAHFLIFICKLGLINDRIELNESEEGKLKWFDLNNLDKKNMIPSDYLMINEFILKDNRLNIHKTKMIEDGDKYFVESFEK